MNRTETPEPLTCEEVEELAGAYALGALPDGELRAVEAHLGGCAADHSALSDLAQTAAALALACEPVPAPADLGDRIRAAALAPILLLPASEEGRGEGGPARLAGSADAPSVPAARRFPGPSARAGLLALAAALAVIALGLGWLAVAQHDALVAARAQQQGWANVLADLTSGSTLTILQNSGPRAMPPALVVQPHNGSLGYLLVDWPRAPAGKSYQAWLIPQGQKPVSAGVFDGSAAGGAQIVRLDAPIQGMESFAVTLEPEGGSAQPTSQPFLVQSLTP